MSKYIVVIMVVSLLFCFNSKGYCGLLEDLKNAVQEEVDKHNSAQEDATKQSAQVQQQAVENNQANNQKSVEEANERLEEQKEDADLKAFWEKEQPLLNQKIQQGKILKIKDLYLGMNIDDAFKVLSDKLGQGVDGVGEWTAPPYGIFWITYYGNIPIVAADSKKRVITIFLPHPIVDKLYNSDSLPGEDFAKKFVENYHIAKMEPFNEMRGDEFISGWRFISPEGFSLEIALDKNITLKKMVKPSEMKFD